MTEPTKQFSQLWDSGVRSGVIGEIGEKNFALLATLASFMDKSGKCNPSEYSLIKALRKSVRSISDMIRGAKTTMFFGEPILKVYQPKKLVNGSWKWDTNVYIISIQIRERLLTRYHPVGRNPPTETEREIKLKTTFPQASFLRTENLLSNDNQPINDKAINDMRQSVIEKTEFSPITPEEYKNQIRNYDEQLCYDIAIRLEEKHMNFILKEYHDKNCGVAGIEWAYNMTKEDVEAGKAHDKRKLFNFYIQKYKEDRKSNSQ